MGSWAETGVLSCGDFAPALPEVHLAKSQDTSGETPGALLNIIECTGQILTAENCQAQDINSAHAKKP